MRAAVTVNTDGYTDSYLHLPLQAFANQLTPLPSPPPPPPPLQEEKLLVESHLLVATQPPLCLETTTDVVCVTNRLQYNQRKYHTHSMRR